MEYIRIRSMYEGFLFDTYVNMFKCIAEMPKACKSAKH